MIELYYWPTPNGHKITLFLEETGLPYTIIPVNIGKGEQFTPDFLKIGPNNRMPAIIDRDPVDHGEPIPIFKSGAILLYLAEKTGQFLPADLRGRQNVVQWMFWQMGGVGPMFGQANHFKTHTAEPIPYAINRYVNEASRLTAVLDRQLEGKSFINGHDYTIADMINYPWIIVGTRLGLNFDDFPNIKRWTETIAARPATKRAYAKGDEVRNSAPPVSEEERAKVLFGQNAASIRGQAQ